MHRATWTFMLLNEKFPLFPSVHIFVSFRQEFVLNRIICSPGLCKASITSHKVVINLCASYRLSNWSHNSFDFIGCVG